LIAEQTDEHEPALLITSPASDKVATSVTLVGMGVVLAWYVSTIERLDVWSLFVGAALLV